MTCTRCEGSGFLNLAQVPDEILKQYDESGTFDIILSWIKQNTDHDVQVCDCCGDGGNWYGMPGEHYSGGDNRGSNGPYAYNGGLPECS